MVRAFSAKLYRQLHSSLASTRLPRSAALSTTRNNQLIFNKLSGYPLNDRNESLILEWTFHSSRVHNSFSLPTEPAVRLRSARINRCTEGGISTKTKNTFKGIQIALTTIPSLKTQKHKVGVKRSSSQGSLLYPRSIRESSMQDPLAGSSKGRAMGEIYPVLSPPQKP